MQEDSRKRPSKSASIRFFAIHAISTLSAALLYIPGSVLYIFLREFIRPAAPISIVLWLVLMGLELLMFRCIYWSNEFQTPKWALAISSVRFIFWILLLTFTFPFMVRLYPRLSFFVLTLQLTTIIHDLWYIDRKNWK